MQHLPWRLAIVAMLISMYPAQSAPKSGVAWFNEGLAQHRSGQFDDAIHSFKQALELQFNVPGANMRIGRAYAKKNDLDNALAWIEKSAKAGFSNPSLILADADLTQVRADQRFTPILKAMNENARPCEANLGYREFDFWIGEWDVESSGTKSESSIQKLLEGCVILENWYGGGRQAGPGTTGKSMNIYTPSTKKWKQVWVSDTGTVSEFEGELRNGAMHYARTFQQASATVLARMTFTPQANGTVRQLIEQSTDEGKTWVTQFDGIYTRKK